MNSNRMGNALKLRVDGLSEVTTEPSLFLDFSLAREMAELTRLLKREVCVYVSRDGRVQYVNVGESDRADLAALTLRRSEERLSGLRCLHTHPGGNGRLSSVDIQSLKKLRFDAICAIGVTETGISDVSMATLWDNEEGYLIAYAAKPDAIPQDTWLEQVREADRRIKRVTLTEQTKQAERVMLIGTEAASVEELERLTDTAGGETVYKAIQRRGDGLIGTGKIKELALVAQEKDIQLAVYDDELTASEQHTLEEGLGVRVLDRTALILDIFAMRAATREGKMQVELAQCRYRLSRLKGTGEALSRLGGGIGTRGPGEAKLETDRRRLNRRMYELKTQLGALSERRGLMRKQRQKQELPQIALVGYTNAGKSTVLKALCGGEVFCEDKLFATLDPLTRRCEIEKNVPICVTDTVGFIRKLPHQLVEAFRSTLEETVFADVLLHVCDASSPEMFCQMEAVEGVLSEIGAGEIPTLLVLNKCDALTGDLPTLPGSVAISAATGEGLDALKRAVAALLKETRAQRAVTVPYTRGDVLAYIFAHARVLEQEHTEEGTRVVFSAASGEADKIIAKLER
ncbi:MAG: GTPase HflX [Clostridia bacterium]|nr:GTPase HflX [Clostridia bacterium]